jgi:nucleoside-diphosphate-sugar epimerase
MKVLITGGCGYIGSKLVTNLVRSNLDVTVLDTMWFGNSIANKWDQSKLRFIKGDVRCIDDLLAEKFDVVVHLANVANDPSVELNESLSWEINALGTFKILEWAKKSGVKKFVYASSGSVYGVSNEPKVTESTVRNPISAYNKTKMVAEQVVLSYTKEFNVICIRPATVCGFSPRMRLDLAVNSLVFQALDKGLIRVFGGDQMRPHINIEDMVSIYESCVLGSLDLSGIYNAGFENLSIRDLAVLISEKIKCEISYEVSNDPRSYRLDSTKIKEAGFIPRKSVRHAIEDLTQEYESGNLKDELRFHTVEQMKVLNL